MNELERQLLTAAAIGLPIILALTWAISSVVMVALSNSAWQAGKKSSNNETKMKFLLNRETFSELNRITASINQAARSIGRMGASCDNANAAVTRFRAPWKCAFNLYKCPQHRAGTKKKRYTR